jgi:cell wall-associated NlpC family hydrolase/SLT domain-containing protein
MPSAGKIFTAFTKSLQNLGNSMLKPATEFDNYAQWAGILNGSPIGADGTSGSAINALRKQIFGSQGQHTTLWAQSANDASKAAFIASQNSGFLNLTPGTRQANPQFSSYLGNIKDLSLVNPTMDAASLASMFGSLTSARGYYASTMYGYTPALGGNGQISRNAIGNVASSIFRKTMNGRTTVSPQELAASLGQNGYLNANIAAYVKSAGGDQSTVTALENYITAQNTASLHGMSQQQFTSLMNQYEAGGSAGDAAGKKLQSIGITNSILQSQKNVTAAKNTTTNDLLDQFGPALKDANAALTKFTNLVNSIVNTPGIKQILGAGAGWGTTFGGLLGGLGGGMLMRGLGGRLLGGGASSLLGAGGLGEGGLLAGGAGSLLAGALPVATGLVGAYGIAHFGHQATSHIKNSKARGAANLLVDAGAGAATGAAIGSVVPGIGTGIGAAIGGTIGVGWNLFRNSRTTSTDGRQGGAAGSSKGGASPSSGQPVAGKTAAAAIEAALSELGKPYQWGGTGPDAFDCSGLMQYAYRQIGVQLPRVSEDQMNVGQAVKQADARPGDLMFPYPGHVVMYLGNNKIVEAPRTGENIRISPVSEYGQYVAIRRIVGSVGSYSGATDQTSNTQKSQANNAGGNSGASSLGNAYGSTEEVDAITSALAGVQHSVATSPMNDSSTSAGDGVGSADAGNYNFGPIHGKATDIPAPPAWVKTAVLKGMSAAGVSGAAWARGLVTVAYRESSFNAKAQNNYDSNAKAGTPSQGLMQVIRPTFESFRAKSLPDDPFDPAASVAASADYIKGRYKNISNVQQANPDLPPQGYAVGAWEIPQDHVAMVHKGEMIIEKPKADTIRQALMRDVVNVKDAATGQSSVVPSSGGITLNFSSGAVQFVISGTGMTAQQAQQAADQFAQALTQNARMKQLARGL